MPDAPDPAKPVRVRTPVLGLFAEESGAGTVAPETWARSRPAAAEDAEGHRRPELAVIVPARDEERNLGGCLASLLAQSEPGFALGREWQLIVVDDGSTDRTREIAAAAKTQHGGSNPEAPAVTVLDAPALHLTSPHPAFTGKNNACWAGAQFAAETNPKWLLFTDADTLHEPGSISRSLREAEKHHATLLSYSPRQITVGIVQRAVMPLVFSELASVYPPAQVNDPKRRVAAANGQFLLVETDAYFSVGGHRAVGPSVLEDVSLARNIKRGGERNIRLRYAPDALSARMYANTGEMIEGWTKNLGLLMPSPIALAAWRVLDLLLFFGLPAIALDWPDMVGWQRAAIGLLWLRSVWRFYSRVGRAHFPAGDTILSILGVPMFIYLLLRSRFSRRVRWKGRTYAKRA